ncbi:MAG: DUF2493 domain-containing protein [Candidatus Cloacimonetes bacterium]|nr:DUF2493 domain-containing protein [Candidatus Cloacimonadota bacterium]
MKLAVIGSKEFTDYEKLVSILDKEKDVSMIISGGALGTDTHAKQYSSQNKIKFLEFPPDYKKYGDKAKYIRDKLVVEHCDKIIAFWDGKCEGTKYTMDYGKKIGKPVKIIRI